MNDVEWEALENKFHGKSLRELEYSEEVLENLANLGLIDRSASIDDDSWKMTEKGIDVIQKRREHINFLKYQKALLVVTSAYTIGTGGLILSNIDVLSNFLPYLGVFLIVIGFTFLLATYSSSIEIKLEEIY